MAGQRPFTYDVFLSFRGSDTRHRFTGHLFKALHDRGFYTFIDDDELPRARGKALVKAIEESRIAIIVFSKNYAASSHCLEVLAYILHYFEGKHQFIFPVFYDVDSFDLQRRRGTYGKALARHEEKFKDNKEKVQTWKNALLQAADLSCWHFKHGDGYEFEFIERIMDEVSRKFHVPLHVAHYPVGLEPRLEEVYSLLELGSHGVLMVGIHGIDGIGKTTLARALYNRIAHQFQVSCFLDGVRENSNKHGLVHLQNMLLSKIVGKKDIQLGNTNEGVSIIKRRLHQKKVLLILDDVDTLEQLEALVGGPDWFGSGSRVIIITGVGHLLAFRGIERRYELQPLDHRDALQLLRQRAFKRGIVDPSYTEILNQIVTYAFGLPLALEVIGSYLFGKSVDEWIYALYQFQSIPSKDIQKILKVSFDSLRQDEKSVFLDIAFCFKGYELTEVQDILRAHYGYNMNYDIEVLIDKLIDKSLLSISSYSKVTLHPLIEDMGKEIVRWESTIEPGKHSRLWFLGDIIQVLKNNTGTSNIEIIHLDSPLSEDEEVIEWDVKAFKRMKHLRTLIIKQCHFSKAPKHLPYSLRVLEWWRYPSQELPSDFDPELLAICKLSNMGIMSPELAELLKISKRDFLTESTWRLVGLVSSIVGLLCNALSPSFNRLIGGWSSFKFFLYGVLSMVILTTILFAKQSSLSTKHVQLKIHMSFAVLMITSVYSFLYDKAVGGKPEILSLVSNAAFALVSLSVSKLIKFGFEMGIFSYFLGCLAVQLFIINWKLILVAIIFGCPLSIMHYSSHSQPEVGSAQVIDSSSDSDPEVDNVGQAIYSTSNYRPNVTSGGQVIHSSLDYRLEVGNDGQHVMDIHT